MHVVVSVTVILVDFSVAIMHVIVSVGIIQLEVSAALMQVIFCASNMWVTIYITYACDILCIQYVGDNLYCLCRWESLLQLCR